MKDLGLCSEVKHGGQIWQTNQNKGRLGHRKLDPAVQKGPKAENQAPGPNLPITSSNRTKGLEAKKEAKTKNYRLPVLDALS